MISAEALSRLLLVLYSAPSTPELWPEFLAELSRALNLTGAAILHHDIGNENYSVEYSSGGDRSWANLYRRYYGNLDVWRPDFLKKAEGEFAFGRELCPESQTKTTEFYNDFLVKFDIRLFGAMATLKGPKQVEHISLYHSWNGPNPDKSASDAMQLIFPHLQSALALRQRFTDLNNRAVSFEAAMDVMANGIIIFDRHRRVLYVNAAADTTLRTGDGLLLRGRNLKATSKPESIRLEALIQACAMTASGQPAGSGGSMLISRRASRPLSVTVMPLGSVAIGSGSAAVILFVYDSERQTRLPINLLREGYSLTKAEARLCHMLAEGNSLPDAAAKCGVTHNTVRSQLQSIFLKTGVRHQGELIRLLLRSGVRS
jgi:DNA-binding CsgD family transcriptional regulator/PAS domain-containing protein